jgi:predicted P-loop ATPase
MDEYKMPTKQAPVNRLFYGHETNQQYREFLGNNFVYMQEYGLFFKKNDSESIDFTNPIKEEDMYLNLIDYGLKINSSIWNSLKNSSSIEKINPLTIFYNQLSVNKWDKKDRLSVLVKSMNLKYDFQENLRLIRKWFINTYSVAFREIDKQIDFMVFPRVVMILHSDQRAFGKTEFFRKIGLSGVMSKQFNNAGFEIYCESQACLPSDKNERKNYLCNHLIYQIDDIDQLMIKGGGELRSIVTQKESSNRVLYTDTNRVKRRTVGIVGTTNNPTLLRDKTENRYMVFTLKERMDFDLLNSIDLIQLWSQIREEAIESGENCKFSSEELELINEFSKVYIYSNPLDDFLETTFEFNEGSCISFPDIKEKVIFENIKCSDKELGTALRRLAPDGKDIKRKFKTERCYKLRKREYQSSNEIIGRDGHDDGLPF